MSECDCCGKDRELTRTFAPGGLETWACAECRGEDPLLAALDRFQYWTANIEFNNDDTLGLDRALAQASLLLMSVRQQIDARWAAARVPRKIHKLNLYKSDFQVINTLTAVEKILDKPLHETTEVELKEVIDIINEVRTKYPSTK